MNWNDKIKMLPDRYIGNKIKALINGTKGASLFQINIYKLAEEWKIDKKELLIHAIYAVKFGLFNLRWEFHCPHCGGSAKDSLHLTDASSEDYCPICDVNFKNSLDKNIEVFFSINENIKKIPSKVKKQYKMAQMKQIQQDGMLNWMTEYSIRGIDCINLPIFSELLGNETLALDQSLEIKHAVILFTDIKESTAMYEEIGDGKAFRIVRDHFRILFQEIEKEDGLPIKTIGDAIMGVFTDELSAVKAAVSIQKKIIAHPLYINDNGSKKIELKVGIHCGSTIMVTLNGRLDYFGTTVNKAARIQSLSKPNEILISDECMDSTVLRYLKTEFKSGEKFKSKVKGISKELSIYRFKI